MRVQSFITPETERDGGGQRVRGGDMENEEERREDGKRAGERLRKSKQEEGTERGGKGGQRAKIEREKIHLVDRKRKEWRKGQKE